MSDTEPPVQPAFRYDAFISYRHVEPDRGWAKWLHGSLETYRVPKELVAKGFPKCLTRVFRDEEELPANPDLSQAITTALEQSRFLIVVCSPRAVESRWVNAEVEHFRKLGRHDRILSLLIEGEPAASFPAALTQIRRSITDTTGKTREAIEEVEPLAADVRGSRGDAPLRVLRRNASLRLLACILGCRYDDLRQRETERRVRKVTIGAAASLALAIGFATVAAFAMLQRSEAQYQREQASMQATEAKKQYRAYRKQREEQMKLAGVMFAPAEHQRDRERSTEIVADLTDRYRKWLDEWKPDEPQRSQELEAFQNALECIKAGETIRDIVSKRLSASFVASVKEAESLEPDTQAVVRTSAALFLRILGDEEAALGLLDPANCSGLLPEFLNSSHFMAIAISELRCSILTEANRPKEAVKEAARLLGLLERRIGLRAPTSIRVQRDVLQLGRRSDSVITDPNTARIVGLAEVQIAETERLRKAFPETLVALEELEKGVFALDELDYEEAENRLRAAQAVFVKVGAPVAEESRLCAALLTRIAEAPRANSGKRIP